MGIGASIFLIAIGLILALALDFSVSGVDLQTIGWILVAVGVLGLIMTAVIWAPRRRDTGADYREERIIRDDRPPY